MHLELERFEGSGERKVALIFSPIHLSQKEELEKVFGTIRKEHNDVEIVCLSSLAGVILDGSIRKDAVVGFVLSGVKEVLVVKRGEIEKAAYKLKEYDVGFALAFSDYDSSPLLEELTELLEDVNIPIAGGVASDDFTLKDTYLIYEGSLVKDAVLRRLCI